MNTVTLSRKPYRSDIKDDAEEVFLVDAALPGADPFPGPAHQDWTEFRAESPTEASFVWRTGAQRFLSVAKAVVEGQLSIEKALRSFLVRRFLEVRLDEVPEADDREATSGEGGGPEVRLLKKALEEKDEVLATCCDQAFYSGENDDYLHDAARTLPLPPWARYKRGAPGGMASDYDEPLIILDPGKRLEELEAWLRRWEEIPRLRKADPAFDVPSIPLVSGEPQRFRVPPRATPSGGRARAANASTFRVANDYVYVEQRGDLSLRRLQGGPLKGPAGIALAALLRDARKGVVRLEEHRAGRWRPTLGGGRLARQIGRSVLHEAADPNTPPPTGDDP